MRKAFTLLELLAVIAIITLLIGVLLPAVQGVREAGRRTQCINHQRNVAVALLNYENTRGSLPGWRDLITTSMSVNNGNKTYPVAAQASWVYCILPHIEQTSLYDQLKSVSVSSTIPAMPLLHCPSLEEGPQSRGTHYVVNGGAVDEFEREGLDGVGKTTVDGNIANGPFLDRAGIIGYTGNGRYAPAYFDAKNRYAVVRESDISKMDGTAYTLLTSENCQRGYWISEEQTHFYHNTAGTMSTTTGYHPLPASDGRAAIELAGILDTIEGSVAFCWPRIYPHGMPEDENIARPITYPLVSQKDGANMYQGFTGAQALANPPLDPVYDDFVPYQRVPIIENAGLVTIPVYVNLFNRKTFSSWYHSARPSSMHVGVIIASFCDGNVRRLSTEIYEMTFVQLMTVSDAQSDAGTKLPTNPAGDRNFLEGQLFDPGVL